MAIRILPPNLINQIAAGEVVERPASAVKELVENSVDAGATRIDITLIDGGRSLIKITDNGSGINKDELPLAITRHATSKLSNDDLFNISFMGFRGEALPSIGSVSRLSISSRTKDADNAWSIKVEGGEISNIAPCAHPLGTTIEVRDLFFATPARLKFLKNATTETSYCIDMVERIAMANPHISFSLDDGNRKRINLASASTGDLFDARLRRLSAIMGKDFADNSLNIDLERDGAKITGYASLPTYNKGNSLSQYLFVNNRPVKDKLLNGAVRAAYQDFLASNRYPYVALFVDIEPRDVDVNVHPAKAEVRFRDAGNIRGMIVGGLKNALASNGHRASTTVGIGTLGSFIAEGSNQQISSNAPPQGFFADRNRISQSQYARGSALQSPINLQQDPVNYDFGLNDVASARVIEEYQTSTPTNFDQETGEVKEGYPLGLAKAQLHKTYIVAQTDDGLVIVDQHAAHERLVYEKMKNNLEQGSVKSQMLLLPEIIEVEDSIADKMADKAEDFAKLGLVLEKFGNGAIIVRETPALLGQMDIKGLIKNLADEIAEWGKDFELTGKLHDVCATMACHGSVRSGRILNVQEMNELLRQMEATPHSGQCNHGRPTYVKLQLKDIERLFGR